MEGKIVCVLPQVTLEGSNPEEFKYIMFSNFAIDVDDIQEVKTLPGEDGPGGRTDIFFTVKHEDIGKFAIPRLQAGIRWWSDVLGNGGGGIYPKEIHDKYGNG